VGSNERVRVDLRFIAATNEDLDRMIARKAFRKDLYYRIRGGWLHLPPLRERPDDIPLLIDSFLSRYDGPNEAAGRGQRVTPGALERLTAYGWPGNVRELKSVIQSAANLAQGNPIGTRHLPEHMQVLPKRKSALAGNGQGATIIRPLADVEKDHILTAYNRLDQNKSQTAKALGIGLNTLRRKLDSYGIV